MSICMVFKSLKNIPKSSIYVTPEDGQYNEFNDPGMGYNNIDKTNAFIVMLYTLLITERI